jgi:hypothetical protein
MGRKPIWKMTDLQEMHTRILEALENAPLSPSEISRILVEKYPNMPEIQRWNGELGNVARYVVSRRLTFLKNRRYVEATDNGKWRLVMKTPLRNEVIRAKSLEWDLSPENTVYRLLDSYIDKDRDEWEQYVAQSQQREKALKELEAKLEQTRRKLEETSPI